MEKKDEKEIIKWRTKKVANWVENDEETRVNHQKLVIVQKLFAVYYNIEASHSWYKDRKQKEKNKILGTKYFIAN